jgi:hypothetical protein
MGSTQQPLPVLVLLRRALHEPLELALELDEDRAKAELENLRSAIVRWPPSACSARSAAPSGN